MTFGHEVAGTAAQWGDAHVLGIDEDVAALLITRNAEKASEPLRPGSVAFALVAKTN